MAKTPPEYRDAWDVVVLHEREWRALMLRVARGNHALADTLYSEVVVERAAAIWARWRPDGGANRKTHFGKCVRWYAFKYLRRRQRRHRPFAALPTDCAEAGHFAERAAAYATAREVLDAVPDCEAAALRARYALGMTVPEAAEFLGVPRSEVRRLCDAGIARARAAFPDEVIE